MHAFNGILFCCSSRLFAENPDEVYEKTVQINGQETTLQIVDTPAYGSVSIFAPPPPPRPAHLI